MTNLSRDNIIDAIRQNKPVAIPHPLLRDFAFSWIEGNTLALFKKNLKAADGDFYRLENIKDALPLIKKLYPDAKVICSATTEIKGNRRIRADDSLHSLEDVDVCIFRARFGIAENGAIWVTNEDLIVNTQGALSQNLVLLLNPAAIVTNMHAAYEKACLHQHQYGCFMMGPSATAETGAVHVNGAQGARSLIVFFV